MIAEASVEAAVAAEVLGAVGSPIWHNFTARLGAAVATAVSEGVDCVMPESCVAAAVAAATFFGVPIAIVSVSANVGAAVAAATLGGVTALIALA